MFADHIVDTAQQRMGGQGIRPSFGKAEQRRVDGGANFFGKNQRTRYQLDWRQVLLTSSRLRLGWDLVVGDSGPRWRRGESVIAEVGDHEGLAIPQRIL